VLCVGGCFLPGLLRGVSEGVRGDGAERRDVMSRSDRDTEVIAWLLICSTCSLAPGKLTAL
jgi:hypothetical protein